MMIFLNWTRRTIRPLVAGVIMLFAAGTPVLASWSQILGQMPDSTVCSTGSGQLEPGSNSAHLNAHPRLVIDTAKGGRCCDFKITHNGINGPSVKRQPRTSNYPTFANLTVCDAPMD